MERCNYARGVFLSPFNSSIHSLATLRGDNGIYKSIDGGASWFDITPRNYQINSNGWGCYFLNESVGVFLEGGCLDGRQKFHKTTDGGASWTRFIGNEFNSGLSDAILEPDGTGFAVSSGVLWRTFDYGSTWSIFSRTGQKHWNEELAYKGKNLLPTYFWF